MLKNFFYYVLGLFIVGAFIAYLTSFVLSYLPYILTLFLLLIPIYGVIRHRKNWTQEYLGVKSWIKAFWSIFRFGRSSVSFYLVLGIVVGFLHEEIISLVIQTALTCILSIVVFMLVWEVVRRLVYQRGIQMESFAEAFKKAFF